MGAMPHYRIRIPDRQKETSESVENAAESKSSANNGKGDRLADATKEVGGPKGPEPTRFGDWERDGRCVDF
ncbi:MAG: DUF1674 domain-containing protein [Alphaproteobacteria bacterium]|nr:DUF1674 domain-containing protein [Alphaproteobacteria bacterium]